MGPTGFIGIIGLAHPGQSGLELLAQVGVGASTVKGGPVDACFVGEGDDVAFAAGRDLAANRNSMWEIGKRMGVGTD
jgi:hypothetical protein